MRYGIERMGRSRPSTIARSPRFAVIALPQPGRCAGPAGAGRLSFVALEDLVEDLRELAARAEDPPGYESRTVGLP